MKKREETREKREGSIAGHCAGGGWIRNSAIPWPSTKGLREFKRFAVVYGASCPYVAHIGAGIVSPDRFRNSLAQRVHRENAAISMRTFLRCCARMGRGATPAR